MDFRASPLASINMIPYPQFKRNRKIRGSWLVGSWLVVIGYSVQTVPSGKYED